MFAPSSKCNISLFIGVAESLSMKNLKMIIKRGDIDLIKILFEQDPYFILFSLSMLIGEENMWLR